MDEDVRQETQCEAEAPPQGRALREVNCDGTVQRELSKWILQEPEKTQERTHQEIMTNWFKYQDCWRRIVAYDLKDKKYTFVGDDLYNHSVYKNFFNDLEMSELPEERC